MRDVDNPASPVAMDHSRAWHYLHMMIERRVRLSFAAGSQDQRTHSNLPDH